MKIRSLIGLGLEPFGSVLESVSQRRSCVLVHANDADDLLRQLAAGVMLDLVLLNSAEPKLKSILETFRRESPETVLALVTDGHKNCDSLRDEVFAILHLPITEDTLTVLFDAAEKHRDLINETAHYRALEANYAEELIGHSEPIRKVFQEIYSLARGQNHVLLTGECGVGKTLLARTLHRSSTRECRPLITANCRQLPGKLLERKLFYFRESSGGGLREPFGRLWDLALGGTLYLERVECMDPDIQKRLLDSLSEGDAGRASGTHALARRLILSTRISPAELKTQGFNAGLLDRVSDICVPALKERRDDVPLLGDYFLKQFNQRYDLKSVLNTDAREALFKYDWPGNIRELKICIERAVFQAARGNITAEHLGFNDRGAAEALPGAQKASAPPPAAPTAKAAAGPAAALGAPSAPATSAPAAAIDATQIVFRVGQSLEEIESEMITKTMEQTDNNRTQAAKMLDISVRTLYTKLLDIEQRGKIPGKAGKKPTDPPGKGAP